MANLLRTKQEELAKIESEQLQALADRAGDARRAQNRVHGLASERAERAAEGGCAPDRVAAGRRAESAGRRARDQVRSALDGGRRAACSKRTPSFARPHRPRAGRQSSASQPPTQRRAPSRQSGGRVRQSDVPDRAESAAEHSGADRRRADRARGLGSGLQVPLHGDQAGSSAA